MKKISTTVKQIETCNTSSCNVRSKIDSEKNKEQNDAKEFNLKLKTLYCFDFRFGDPFCGIKKFSLRFNDEEVEILSNGSLKNDIIPNKNEILKELEHFNFSNWKEKYTGNPNPKFENYWSITLRFENENIEFVGLDDYPQVWPYVEWFVNKYSRFHLEKSIF